jgi:hypothetical protein
MKYISSLVNNLMGRVVCRALFKEDLIVEAKIYI